MSKRNTKAKSQFPKNAKYCACFDTNIVIFLAGLHYKDKTIIDDLKRFGHYDEMVELKHLVDTKQVTAIITPTVLTELFAGVPTHGSNTISYLKTNNFFVLDMPEDELKKYFERTEALAEHYSTHLSDLALKRIALSRNMSANDFCNCVFKTKRDKFGNPVISNDARVLAESCELGLKLITNNTQDFTNRNRQHLIQHFNQSMQLSAKALPHTAREFLAIYQRNMFCPKPNKEYSTSFCRAEDGLTPQ